MCLCSLYKNKDEGGGWDKGRETSKEEGEDNQELDWGNFLNIINQKKKKEMKLFKVEKREMM